MLKEEVKQALISLIVIAFILTVFLLLYNLINFTGTALNDISINSGLKAGELFPVAFSC